MPSTVQLPDPSNDYAVPPSGLELGVTEWDAVFGSIGSRLRSLEAVRASFDALISEGTDQALLVIQQNVGPQIVSLTTEIAQLVQSVALAQAAANALLGGGLPATNIVTDSAHRFLTDAQIAQFNSAATLDDVIAFSIALGS